MKLRYFFEPGTNICLWAADDTAREKFGYAVEFEDLPLSEALVQQALKLATWFETSIDWSYPADPSPWNEAERQRFILSCNDFYRILAEALGPDYEVINEESMHRNHEN
jgi:hypothetical protein